MKMINVSELEKIKGGETFSASIINSLTNLIKVLHDAGYSLGSGIRRISEDELCSLK